MKRRSSAAMGFVVILFFSIAAFTISGIAPDADAASYKRGSYGSTVSQIQQKLKDWGYYSAEVDGIYGSRTEKAVRYFQSKNGLAVDGVVGEKTLAALGMSSGGSSGGGYASNSENDVQLLARLISGEARGEPYTGQVAVGAVVLNRVDHPSFPNSISGVIYQSGAFDAVADGQINMTPTDSCVRAAREALAGSDPSGGAIYYYNPATATSKWIWSRQIICTIGKHNFAI